MKLKMWTKKVLIFTAICLSLAYVCAIAGNLNSKSVFPLSVLIHYSEAYTSGKITEVHRKIPIEEIVEIDISTLYIDVRIQPSTADTIDLDLKTLVADAKIDESSILETKIEGAKLVVRTLEDKKIKNWRINWVVSPDKESLMVDAHKDSSLIVSVPEKVKTIIFKTTSGDLRLDIVNLNALQMTSISGGLSLRNTLVSYIEAATISGDIEGTGTYTKLNAQTVSGDIELDIENLDPVLALNTTSGDIELAFSELPNLKINFASVSGDFDIKKSLAKSELESSGSKVALTLGSGMGTVDVQTVSGDLAIKKID